MQLIRKEGEGATLILIKKARGCVQKPVFHFRCFGRSLVFPRFLSKINTEPGERGGTKNDKIMKVARLLLTFAMSGALMACTMEKVIPETENKPDEPETEQEEYLVSLALTGEIEVSQEPLSKSTPTDDLYGINIYYDWEHDGLTNDRYGYGLFDNKEDMKVALLKGHKYRFVCSLVKDGKNTLYYGPALGQSYSGYAYPFQISSTEPSILENKSTVHLGFFLRGLASGSAHLKGQTTPTIDNAYKYAPGVERYYGESDDYTPVEGGVVSIALKKTVFGAKFMIEGIQDGTLTASCGDLWSKTTSVDDAGTAIIYSYPDQQDCWLNESTLPMTVSLSFQDNGSGKTLDATKSVTFKRNTLTVVTLQIPTRTFSITEEALDEDHYIDMDLNSDDLWNNSGYHGGEPGE
jgi:hypothetical protein